MLWMDISADVEHASTTGNVSGFSVTVNSSIGDCKSLSVPLQSTTSLLQNGASPYESSTVPCHSIDSTAHQPMHPSRTRSKPRAGMSPSIHLSHLRHNGRPHRLEDASSTQSSLGGTLPSPSITVSSFMDTSVPESMSAQTVPDFRASTVQASLPTHRNTIHAEVLDLSPALEGPLPPHTCASTKSTSLATHADTAEAYADTKLSPAHNHTPPYDSQPTQGVSPKPPPHRRVAPTHAHWISAKENAATSRHHPWSSSQPPHAHLSESSDSSSSSLSPPLPSSQPSVPQSSSHRPTSRTASTTAHITVTPKMASSTATSVVSPPARVPASSYTLSSSPPSTSPSGYTSASTFTSASTSTSLPTSVAHARSRSRPHTNAIPSTFSSTAFTASTSSNAPPCAQSTSTMSPTRARHAVPEYDGALMTHGPLPGRLSGKHVQFRENCVSERMYDIPEFTETTTTSDTDISELQAEITQLESSLKSANLKNGENLKFPKKGRSTHGQNSNARVYSGTSALSPPSFSPPSSSSSLPSSSSCTSSTSLTPSTSSPSSTSFPPSFSTSAASSDTSSLTSFSFSPSPSCSSSFSSPSSSFSPHTSPHMSSRTTLASARALAPAALPAPYSSIPCLPPALLPVQALPASHRSTATTSTTPTLAAATSTTHVQQPPTNPYSTYPLRRPAGPQLPRAQLNSYTLQPVITIAPPHSSTLQSHNTNSGLNGGAALTTVIPNTVRCAATSTPVAAAARISWAAAQAAAPAIDDDDVQARAAEVAEEDYWEHTPTPTQRVSLYVSKPLINPAGVDTRARTPHTNAYADTHTRADAPMDENMESQGDAGMPSGVLPRGMRNVYGVEGVVAGHDALGASSVVVEEHPRNLRAYYRVLPHPSPYSTAEEHYAHHHREQCTDSCSDSHRQVNEGKSTENKESTKLFPTTWSSCLPIEPKIDTKNPKWSLTVKFPENFSHIPSIPPKYYYLSHTTLNALAFFTAALTRKTRISRILPDFPKWEDFNPTFAWVAMGEHTIAEPLRARLRAILAQRKVIMATLVPQYTSPQQHTATASTPAASASTSTATTASLPRQASTSGAIASSSAEPMAPATDTMSTDTTPTGTAALSSSAGRGGHVERVVDADITEEDACRGVVRVAKATVTDAISGEEEPESAGDCDSRRHTPPAAQLATTSNANNKTADTNASGCKAPTSTTISVSPVTFTSVTSVNSTSGNTSSACRTHTQGSYRPSYLLHTASSHLRHTSQRRDRLRSAAEAEKEKCAQPSLNVEILHVGSNLGPERRYLHLHHGQMICGGTKPMDMQGYMEEMGYGFRKSHENSEFGGNSSSGENIPGLDVPRIVLNGGKNMLLRENMHTASGIRLAMQEIMHILLGNLISVTDNASVRVRDWNDVLGCFSTSLTATQAQTRTRTRTGDKGVVSPTNTHMDLMPLEAPPLLAADPTLERMVHTVCNPSTHSDALSTQNLKYLSQLLKARVGMYRELMQKLGHVCGECGVRVEEVLVPVNEAFQQHEMQMRAMFPDFIREKIYKPSGKTVSNDSGISVSSLLSASPTASEHIDPESIDAMSDAEVFFREEFRKSKGLSQQYMTESINPILDGKILKNSEDDLTSQNRASPAFAFSSASVMSSSPSPSASTSSALPPSAYSSSSSRTSCTPIALLHLLQAYATMVDNARQQWIGVAGKFYKRDGKYLPCACGGLTGSGRRHCQSCDYAISPSTARASTRSNMHARAHTHRPRVLFGGKYDECLAARRARVAWLSLMQKQQTFNQLLKVLRYCERLRILVGEYHRLQAHARVLYSHVQERQTQQQLDDHYTHVQKRKERELQAAKVAFDACVQSVVVERHAMLSRVDEWRERTTVAKWKAFVCRQKSNRAAADISAQMLRCRDTLRVWGYFAHKRVDLRSAFRQWRGRRLTEGWKNWRSFFLARNGRFEDIRILHRPNCLCQSRENDPEFTSIPGKFSKFRRMNSCACPIAPTTSDPYLFTRDKMSALSKIAAKMHRKAVLIDAYKTLRDRMWRRRPSVALLRRQGEQRAEVHVALLHKDLEKQARSTRAPALSSARQARTPPIAAADLSPARVRWLVSTGGRDAVMTLRPALQEAVRRVVRVEVERRKRDAFRVWLATLMRARGGVITRTPASAETLGSTSDLRHTNFPLDDLATHRESMLSDESTLSLPFASNTSAESSYFDFSDLMPRVPVARQPPCESDTNEEAKADEYPYSAKKIHRTDASPSHASDLTSFRERVKLFSEAMDAAHAWAPMKTPLPTPPALLLSRLSSLLARGAMALPCSLAANSNDTHGDAHGGDDNQDESGGAFNGAHQEAVCIDVARTQLLYLYRQWHRETHTPIHSSPFATTSNAHASSVQTHVNTQAMASSGIFALPRRPPRSSGSDIVPIRRASHPTALSVSPTQRIATTMSASTSCSSSTTSSTLASGTPRISSSSTSSSSPVMRSTRDYTDVTLSRRQWLTAVLVDRQVLLAQSWQHWRAVAMARREAQRHHNTNLVARVWAVWRDKSAKSRVLEGMCGILHRNAARNALHDWRAESHHRRTLLHRTLTTMMRTVEGSEANDVAFSAHAHTLLRKSFRQWKHRLQANHSKLQRLSACLQRAKRRALTETLLQWHVNAKTDAYVQRVSHAAAHVCLQRWHAMAKSSARARVVLMAADASTRVERLQRGVAVLKRGMALRRAFQHVKTTHTRCLKLHLLEYWRRSAAVKRAYAEQLKKTGLSLFRSKIREWKNDEEQNAKIIRKLRVSHALRDFRTLIQAKKRDRLRLQSAQESINPEKRLKLDFFRKWRSQLFSITEHRRRQQEDTAILKLRFQQWRQCARKHALLSRASDLKKKARMRDALDQWRQYSAKQTRLHTVSSLVADKHLRKEKKAVFYAWHSLLAYRRQQKRTLLTHWRTLALERRRERVAVGWDRQRVVRHVLTLMSARVHSHRADEALADELREKHCLRKMQSTWEKWRERLSEKYENREMLRAADIFRTQWLRRKRIVGALQVWCEYVADSRQTAAAEDAVYRARQRRTLHNIFAAWRQATMERRMGTGAREYIEQVHTNAVVVRAFHGWLAHAQRSKRLARASALVKGIHPHYVAKQAFRVWRDQMQQLQRHRRGLVVLALLRARTTLHTLGTWAQRQADMRVRTQEGVARSLIARVRGCIHTFRRHARHRAQQRVNMAVAEATQRSALLSAAFQTMKARLVHEAHKKRVLCSHLRVWKAVLDHQRTAHALAVEYHYQVVQAREKRDAWGVLCCVWDTARTREVQLEAIVEDMHDRQRRRAIIQWRDSLQRTVSRRAALGMAYEDVTHLRQRALLARMWSLWKHRAREALLVKFADKWCERRVKMRAWNEMLVSAREAVLQRQLETIAAHVHTRTVKKKLLLLWKQAAMARQAAYQSAAHRFWLETWRKRTKNAILALQAHAVTHRAQVQQRAVADSLYSYRTQEHVFREWVHAASAKVTLRRKGEYLRNMTSRQVLLRHLHQWRQLGRTYQLDAALMRAAQRQYLISTVRHWNKYAVAEKRRDRQQYMMAKTALKHQGLLLKRDALNTWHNAFHVVQQLQSKDVVVRAHLDRRKLRCILSSWRELTLYTREKRGDALLHWRVLLKKAITVSRDSHSIAAKVKKHLAARVCVTHPLCELMLAQHASVPAQHLTITLADTLLHPCTCEHYPSSSISVSTSALAYTSTSNSSSVPTAYDNHQRDTYPPGAHADHGAANGCRFHLQHHNTLLDATHARADTRTVRWRPTHALWEPLPTLTPLDNGSSSLAPGAMSQQVVSGQYHSELGVDMPVFRVNFMQLWRSMNALPVSTRQTQEMLMQYCNLQQLHGAIENLPLSGWDSDEEVEFITPSSSQFDLEMREMYNSRRIQADNELSEAYSWRQHHAHTHTHPWELLAPRKSDVSRDPVRALSTLSTGLGKSALPLVVAHTHAPLVLTAHAALPNPSPSITSHLTTLLTSPLSTCTITMPTCDTLHLLRRLCISVCGLVPSPRSSSLILSEPPARTPADEKKAKSSLTLLFSSWRDWAHTRNARRKAQVHASAMKARLAFRKWRGGLLRHNMKDGITITTTTDANGIEEARLSEQGTVTHPTYSTHFAHQTHVPMSVNPQWNSLCTCQFDNAAEYQPKNTSLVRACGICSVQLRTIVSEKASACNVWSTRMRTRAIVQHNAQIWATSRRDVEEPRGYHYHDDGGETDNTHLSICAVGEESDSDGDDSVDSSSGNHIIFHT